MVISTSKFMLYFGKKINRVKTWKWGGNYSTVSLPLIIANYPVTSDIQKDKITNCISALGFGK